jgi:hypothetical protein
MQTNDLINSGSQLSWTFSNNSSVNVTLLSLQLIDGVTNREGNLMDVNKIVGAGSSLSYNTTIGGLGIHVPVTCRFRYSYNGNEYYTDAVYKESSVPDITSDVKLTITATGNGTVTYNGSSIRNSKETFSIRFLDDASISFTPDYGYRLKSVKVNNSDSKWLQNDSLSSNMKLLQTFSRVLIHPSKLITWPPVSLVSGI